jgi:HEAT repeat protein
MGSLTTDFNTKGNDKMSKSRISIALVAAFLFTCTFYFSVQVVSADTSEQVSKLIAVLKSDAGHKEKADACRELAVVGTKEAVPVLAEMLADEKLSHMARYALEPIPDSSVDQALRDALGKLEGLPLVGVIGSIGVRRDTKAVPVLTEKLNDEDPQVAQAAAKALGNIADLSCAEAIQSALSDASAENQLVLYESLFRCAETISVEGRSKKAVAIYDKICAMDAPHQVRAAAVRGAILTRPQKEGLKVLKENLQKDDYILFSAAVQASVEMPGEKVTWALAGRLKQPPDDNKILIIKTLGARGDASALPELFALTKSGPKSIRLEAIKSLPRIGHPSAIAVLVDLLSDPDLEVSKTAQESLAALPGEETDSAVMEMLNSDEAGQQLMSLELIGRRRMTESVPVLLEIAGGEGKVRPAALKKVGELASVAELPAMLELFMSLKEKKDLNAAEQALRNICVRAEDRDWCTGKLLEILPGSEPAHKCALLRILSTLGGDRALQAVRAAVKDSNEQVRAAAIRALGAWKTADAAPDLLALAKAAKDQKEKTICLRAYMGFASRPDIPVKKRLSMCKKAGDLIVQDNEKKLLLAAFGSIESPEVFAMIVPYLDDPATRQEACIASVTVAEKLLKRNNASKSASSMIKPLEKVAEVAANPDLSKRAENLLKKAKSL